MVRITSDCLPCLRRLIELTVREASPIPVLARHAIAHAWGIVEEMKGGPFSPAHVANRFLPVIAEICRNPDPFADRKRREMAVASRIASHHRLPATASLEQLVSFSLQGNCIDFFRAAEDLDTLLAAPATMGINQLESLKVRLDAPGKCILWLADNSGEVFFDLPLVLSWMERGHQVFYAVKSGPIQNDLTKTDLDRWSEGLPPLNVIETGAATVGVELERVSKEFLRVYNSADVIIAKGMGHFETLGGCDDPRLFFLLMAKCDPVARALNIAVNHCAAFFAHTQAAVRCGY